MEPLSLQEIAGFIDNYQYGMDYSRVSEILRSQKNKAYDILYTAERKLIQEKSH